ncbi:DNA gyrase subunit B [Streptomyces sp. NPDC047072]|uniref:DNA gyrase subunit B n=1 Tax=Streptomyces sp. NPDC047072 TaxID=3154809 RepID=UPI0033CF6DBD
MSHEGVRYDGSRIEVLEGLAAVRKRPGMWVGSTGERGVRHMVFAVVDRAVNDVLAAGSGSVDVTLRPDGVRVVDGGSGIPVEAAGHSGEPTLEAVLSRWGAEKYVGGRHVVDATPFFNNWLFVVNALSSRLTVEVRRGGERWVQEYARGVAAGPPVTAGPATGTGTTFFFRPDDEIFATTECSYEALEQRLRELALLNPGLELSLTDERTPGESRACRFRFPGGTRDFVALLERGAGSPVHADVVHVEREDPRMAGIVEVALRWSDADDERMRSFANSRATTEGGTHVAGFRAGLAAALTSYGRSRGLLTADDPDFGPGQIGRGLTSVVAVRLDTPEFEGATRGRLGGGEVREGVEEIVREHLSAWLVEHPEEAAAVIGICRLPWNPQDEFDLHSSTVTN